MNTKGRLDRTTLRFDQSQVQLARTIPESAEGPSWSELNVLLYGSPVAPIPEQWRVALKDDQVTYWVSDLGNFAALRVKPARVWNGYDPKGYPKFVVYVKGAKAPRDIHRVVAETFHGPRPSGMVILHLNSNNRCAHVNNLRHGTQRENMLAKAEKERGVVPKIHPPEHEVYKWHPRYPSLAVSNLGTAITRWWVAFNTAGSFYSAGSGDRAKHVGVTVTLHGKKKTLLLHRLVYVAFVGPIPEGKLVRHKDDNPHHNYVGNLAIGSGKDNARDRATNGGDRYGDAHPNAKYPDAARRKLIGLLKKGVRTPKAAVQSGIKLHNAHRIRRRWLDGKPVLASKRVV